ncbi:S24 family peptidase [Rhodanobacter sp. AS-Z3]|uniref:S24 family peptidase n=1 Tax=Rhodanobacter sp. AS-Z3 TaxID=3031330 RepID=UPI00247A8EB9|nr:LexA family transcriptional regulator [Rhodanobacter sp. AS-Z3]WEN13682.1 S24 family peptidase [Rhodanobacter sp. AS-Z3]
MNEPRAHPSSIRLAEAAERMGDSSPTAIARRLNVSVQKVSNWISRGVSKEGALEAQAAYNVDANWILGSTTDARLSVRESEAPYSSGRSTAPISPDDDSIGYLGRPPLWRVPIRGNAGVNKQGFWFQLDNDSAFESFFYPTTDPAAYAIRIKGDSYDPAIEADDCVLIEPSVALRIDGRVLICLKDGRSTIQRLRVYNQHEYKLQSITNSGERTTISASEVESAHFVRGNFSMHGLGVDS